ncbi:hypothetical protein RR46_08202 [Papilio xuthus]|uniref:Uncharacterized protein n=1 Tax=Papilio xuthus TaxID=66420 RepID=A0A194QBN9_PAPXU|nr:hypothetical protein RR46_08202 [Papilio xuthus]
MSGGGHRGAPQHAQRRAHVSACRRASCPQRSSRSRPDTLPPSAAAQWIGDSRASSHSNQVSVRRLRGVTFAARRRLASGGRVGGCADQPPLSFTHTTPRPTPKQQDFNAACAHKEHFEGASWFTMSTEQKAFLKDSSVLVHALSIYFCRE